MLPVERGEEDFQLELKYFPSEVVISESIEILINRRTEFISLRVDLD